MSELTDSSSRLESDESDESYHEDEKNKKNLSDSLIFVEEPKTLSRSEASDCLSTLGKCDSGLGYAYLVMDVSKKNLNDVTIIPTFKHVLRINVSSNHLTMEALQVLSKMSFLLMLQADRNDLSGSPKMDPMPFLQVLTLNKNNLTDTEGILHPLLEILELNYNKLTQIFLDSEILKRLQILELRGNCLSTINGINFSNLVRLYVAENQIDRLEGLEKLVNLKILHLRDNQISSLIFDGYEKRNNVKLNYINLRNNKIEKISELRALANLVNLETLVVLGNPVIELESEEEESFDSYRIKILVLLPNLKRIDKDAILQNERREASIWRQKLLQEKMSSLELDMQDFLEDE